MAFFGSRLVWKSEIAVDSLLKFCSGRGTKYMATELVCGLGLRAPHLVINFNACNFLKLTVTKCEVEAFQIDAFSA